MRHLIIITWALLLAGSAWAEEYLVVWPTGGTTCSLNGLCIHSPNAVESKITDTEPAAIKLVEELEGARVWKAKRRLPPCREEGCPIDFIELEPTTEKRLKEKPLELTHVKLHTCNEDCEDDQ